MTVFEKAIENYAKNRKKFYDLKLKQDIKKGRQKVIGFGNRNGEGAEMKVGGKGRWRKVKISYELDDGTRVCHNMEVNMRIPKATRHRKPVCFIGWGAKEFFEWATKNVKVTKIECDHGRVRMDCFGGRGGTQVGCSD